MAINTGNPVPINPYAPEYQQLLEDLQGNILKDHGRDYAAHIFLQFTGDPDEIKERLRSYAHYVTSAKQQREDAVIYQRIKEDPTKIKAGDAPFVNFFLSAKGYEYLGICPPKDDHFNAGMKAAQLDDPPVSKWEEPYQKEIHAMILLAHGTPIVVQGKTITLASPDRQAILNSVMDDIGKVVEVLTIELGSVLYKSDDPKKEHPVEHFGFRDGISQPLFYDYDLERARQKEDPPSFDKWNPLAPLVLVLEADPNGAGEDRDSYGSFLVFRKLEQNVAKFKKQRTAVARLLGGDSALAGAEVVGRFEDGTPLLDPKLRPGVVNNFNFDSDPDGLVCPLHAHIRKVTFSRDPSSPGSKDHRIVRRGITYGVEKRQPDLEDSPEEGVGLLFMCFQNDIGEKFAYLQKEWANNLYNPSQDGSQVGLDPVIGQGKSMPQHWPPSKAPFSFESCVTLKGGEYFFAPSISFLKNMRVKKSPTRKPGKAPKRKR